MANAKLTARQLFDLAERKARLTPESFREYLKNVFARARREFNIPEEHKLGIATTDDDAETLGLEIGTIYRKTTKSPYPIPEVNSPPTVAGHSLAYEWQLSDVCGEPDAEVVGTNAVLAAFLAEAAIGSTLLFTLTPFGLIAQSASLGQYRLTK